ncbi:MAG: stage II sporulation protein R [Solibacillus sp.]
MYSNYKVQSDRNNHILIAIIKLIASVGVLYSACSIIPQVIQFVEHSYALQTEDFKVRVIANSSSVHDQQIKMQVVEEIQAVVNNNVHVELTQDFFEEVIHNVQKKFPSEDISLSFGENLLPPTYQSTRFYAQNNYQSAVFIIGAGRGENWFCAAFPTVCHGSSSEKKEPVTFMLYDWIVKKSNEKLCTNSEKSYTDDC